MNYMITIAREVIGCTGYKTIKKLETLPRHEALKKLSDKKIARRFKSPFNSSVEVVVIE